MCYVGIITPSCMYIRCTKNKELLAPFFILSNFCFSLSPFHCNSFTLRGRSTGLSHIINLIHHTRTTMSKLPPTSSFDDIPSRGLFCYKCQRSNFSNDSKGRRSHAQHQRNCTGLSKHGVKVSGLHVSGTDPLPLLTKKRRIDELDFNFAYQLDNYLEDNDNFFDVNVDSDHPHDIHDLPSTTPDPFPCPIIHIGARMHFYLQATDFKLNFR